MAMRPEKIAIVGGGVGGLSAAIHAAAAGLHVTLYERNERVGGRANLIERDGFRFDTGPSLLNYPWVFEELFAAAGRRFADAVTLLPVDPTMRFIWPDGVAMSLSSDIAVLAAELERFERSASRRLMEWIADGEARFELVMRRIASTDERSPLRYGLRVGPRNLIKAGILGSMRGSLRRFFRSDRVLDALGAYAMYLGGSPWTLPAAFSVLPYGEIAYGLWLPQGGMYSLVQAMERLAREMGVDVRLNMEVTRVITEAGRARGVQLADGVREAYDAVIVNGDAPSARRELVPDLRPMPRMPAMTPAVVTFYLALRRPPAGLGHHTVFLPQDSRLAFGQLHQGHRLPEDLPFYTAVPSATDPDMAPPGHAVLFVLAPVPLPAYCPEAASPDIITIVRERVVNRLRSHDIAIRTEDVVFAEAWTPSDWQSRFHLHQASAFGAAHTMNQIGPWRWPNSDPAVRGLYYVGASTVPGTGLPTVTIGGRMTVQRLLNDAG